MCVTVLHSQDSFAYTCYLISVGLGSVSPWLTVLTSRTRLFSFYRNLFMRFNALLYPAFFLMLSRRPLYFFANVNLTAIPTGGVRGFNPP